MEREYVEEEDKGESVYFNVALSIQILSGQKIHQNVMISSWLWGGGGGGGERKDDQDNPSWSVSGGEKWWLCNNDCPPVTSRAEN